MEKSKEVEATGKMFDNLELSIFSKPFPAEEVNINEILEKGAGILGFEEIPTLFSKHSIIATYKFTGKYIS